MASKPAPSLRVAHPDDAPPTASIAGENDRPLRRLASPLAAMSDHDFAVALDMLSAVCTDPPSQDVVCSVNTCVPALGADVKALRELAAFGARLPMRPEDVADVLRSALPNDFDTDTFGLLGERLRTIYQLVCHTGGPDRSSIGSTGTAKDRRHSPRYTAAVAMFRRTREKDRGPA